MSLAMKPLTLVTVAADFAARRHVGQRRKGSAAEPAINHLAEVASLLAQAAHGDDPHLIAAGWLHDVVEDTPTKPEEVAELFGAAVADIVAQVTDDKSLPKEERKVRQIAEAPSKSPGAKAVKIADKISNLRSLMVSPPAGWERERLLDYVDWCERVVAGCRGIDGELDRLFDTTARQARQVL